MIDKNFLSLDLELNQPSGKIIQVGAVVGNLKNGEILEEYEQHVKCYEKVNERITKLTGITQENVDNGLPVYAVYDVLKDIMDTFGCFRNCITWGGGDSECLRKQVNVSDKEGFIFGRRWIDVKTVFISYRWSQGLNAQAGLAKALTKMGLEFKGKKHTACDDAKNTFFIYRELLKRIGKNQNIPSIGYNPPPQEQDKVKPFKPTPSPPKKTGD